MMCILVSGNTAEVKIGNTFIFLGLFLFSYEVVLIMNETRMISDLVIDKCHSSIHSKAYYETP